MPETFWEALERLEEDLELDVTQLFEDLGEGPLPRGRPDDYPGVEVQTILHVLPGHVAGKQFRPDPTGKHRAALVSDYRIGEDFIASHVVIESLDDVFKLLKALAIDDAAFLVRGTVAEWAGRLRRRKATGEVVTLLKRRMIDRHEDGSLEDVPRQLQMLDLDGVALPEGMSAVNDPQTSVEWAVDNVLPPEFRDASFVYQMSVSAGLTKSENKLSVHIWFFSHREYSNQQLRSWGGWWNAKRQTKVIDTSVFNPVQPHYTNDPGLLDGLTDPLAGRRLGLVRRRRRTVRLYMPSEADLISEGRLKVGRVREAHRRHQTRSETIQESVDDAPDGAADVDTQVEDEREDYIGVLEAVRFGPGWRGYLEGIGFEGHIRAQIRAAVGSYFRERGRHGDRRVLKDAIVKAIADSPYLDCGDGSRSRSDALEYLAAPSGGRSNVDEMIAYIAERQKISERRAEEVCEPTWPLPTLTAGEAFDQLDKAVRGIVAEALRLRRDRITITAHADGVLPEVFFHTPARTAILCEPGVGKTAAMITAVIALLRADTGARVAIAVPTHYLGQGLADRINQEFGSDVAAEWYGTEHADPRHPDTAMCRLSDAAKELISAGGKLQLLCSSRHDGDCPHNPKVVGLNGCGYLLQQRRALSGNIRVWIVPAVMLALAPLPALRRLGRPIQSDFDLLVIDEAPWFRMVAGIEGAPLGAPVNWLMPEWWEKQSARAPDQDKVRAMETLAKISSVLAGHPCGPVPAEAFGTAGVSDAAIKQARRLVWRYKVDLRGTVTPGASHSKLARSLGDVGSTNRRVMAVAEVLRVLTMHLQGRLPPSGIELIDHPGSGERFLRVRYRRDIHPEWLRAPVLYLDATETGAAEIAEAWLPGIVVAAEARAAAPYMRLTQIVDTSMSYTKIAGKRTQEKLARVVETRGHGGLVLCPKKLRDRWWSTKRLPADWMLWNFGAFRGRDEARDVRHLVVISRTSPPPAETELLAETIFGREVKKLPAHQTYPKRSVGRLLSDGTGRRALADHHPDELVEAVRFAICEGEVLQAIGRGRGVRRTAETPLDVLVLTDVPLPLPIDAFANWKDICDAAGPIEVLVAKGIVPLDYNGMAAALPVWFEKGEAAAKEWFRRRPDAMARLTLVRGRAMRGECVDIRELVGNSNKELSIGNSHQLAPYRYRRTGERQANMILIDHALHGDARAAVEVVFGTLDKFELAAPASENDDCAANSNVVDGEPNEGVGLEAVRRMFAEMGM
jgi:hypothetical protein